MAGERGGVKGFSRRRRCERSEHPRAACLYSVDHRGLEADLFSRQTLPCCVCRFFWRSDGDYPCVGQHISRRKNARRLSPSDLRTTLPGPRALAKRPLASLNQSISSCTFLLTRHPCANCKTTQKKSGFSTKNHRSSMPPDSAFTYGLINLHRAANWRRSLDQQSPRARRDADACGYRFKQAHEKASQRRKEASDKPRKMTPDLVELIEEKLTQEQWSPDQISGRLAKDGVACCSVEDLGRGENWWRGRTHQGRSASESRSPLRLGDKVGLHLGVRD